MWPSAGAYGYVPAHSSIQVAQEHKFILVDTEHKMFRQRQLSIPQTWVIKPNNYKWV